MDRNLKDEAHEGDDGAKFGKADGQVRQQFSEQQTQRAHGSDEELLESAALFFANDGEGGEEGGYVQEQNGGEPGKEKIGRAGIGIEKKLGAHFDGHLSAILQNPAQRFVESDGGGDIDGLTGHGGIGAVDEDEDLRASLVEKAIGVVDWDLDADACAAGDDFIVQIAIVLNVAADVKGVGIFQAIDQLTAFAAAVGVEHDGIDLADVGVNAEAEDHHLQEGDHQGKEKSRGVAADVQRFFEEYGTETAEKVRHEQPRFPPGAYRLILRIHLRGWEPAANLTNLNSVLEE